MNVDIGTEAAQFPEKEYINGIFVAVYQAPEFMGEERKGAYCCNNSCIFSYWP